MDKKELIVLARELAEKTSKSSVVLTERILRSALYSSEDAKTKKKNFFLYLIIAVKNLEAISGEINLQAKEEFKNLVKNVFGLEVDGCYNMENVVSKFKDLDMEEWYYVLGWAKKLNTNKIYRNDKCDNLKSKKHNSSDKVKENNRGKEVIKQKANKSSKGFNTPFADIKLDKLWNEME